MEWWDVVILISGCIAALGTIAGLIWNWWKADSSEAHIAVISNAEMTRIEFFATGPHALHAPTVVADSPGMIQLTTHKDYRILRAEDDPITLTIPTRSGESLSELTAAIQWTEYGRRTPKLRGLFYSLSEHQIWSLDSKRQWKPWSKRRILKYQGRYSQM